MALCLWSMTWETSRWPRFDLDIFRPSAACSYYGDGFGFTFDGSMIKFGCGGRIGARSGFILIKGAGSTIGCDIIWCFGASTMVCGPG